VQCFAVASQKLTCPVVTGLPLEVTVAVSATVFPATTLLTALPPAVMAIFVVVGAGAAKAGCATPERSNHPPATARIGSLGNENEDSRIGGTMI
jgi:hypothetical protein